MITQDVIKEIYKKYSKRPSSPDELNIPPLFEAVHPSHRIQLDEDKIVVNSIPATSIFHSIPLRNVNAILEFESHVAIVLHSSIIFLSKTDGRNFINFKPLERSFMDKLKGSLSRH